MNEQPGPYSGTGSPFDETPEHRMGRLHQELRAIHLELGRLEHDALIRKARLVNRANEIINQLEVE